MPGDHHSEALRATVGMVWYGMGGPYTSTLHTARGSEWAYV